MKRIKKYTVQEVTKLWGVTINALLARLATLMGVKVFTTEEAATALVNDPILAGYRRQTAPTPLKETVYAIILYGNREWVDLGGLQRPTLDEMAEKSDEEISDSISEMARFRVWDDKWLAVNNLVGGWSRAEPRLVTKEQAYSHEIVDQGAVVQADLGMEGGVTKRVGFWAWYYAQMMLRMRLADTPFEILSTAGPNEGGYLLVRYWLGGKDGTDFTLVLPLSPEEFLSIDVLDYLCTQRSPQGETAPEVRDEVRAEVRDEEEEKPEERVEERVEDKRLWGDVAEVVEVVEVTYEENAPANSEDAPTVECDDPACVCEPDCYDCGEPTNSNSPPNSNRVEILGGAIRFLEQEVEEGRERTMKITDRIAEIARQIEDLRDEEEVLRRKVVDQVSKIDRDRDMAARLKGLLK